MHHYLILVELDVRRSAMTSGILAEPSPLAASDPQPRNKPHNKYGGFILPFNQ